MESFNRKRPTAEESLEHRWLQPSEHMLKKRERALFLGNRLKVCPIGNCKRSQCTSLYHALPSRCRNIRKSTTRNEGSSRKFPKPFCPLLVWDWVVLPAIRRTFIPRIKRPGNPERLFSVIRLRTVVSIAALYLLLLVLNNCAPLPEFYFFCFSFQFDRLFFLFSVL